MRDTPGDGAQLDFRCDPYTFFWGDELRVAELGELAIARKDHNSASYNVRPTAGADLVNAPNSCGSGRIGGFFIVKVADERA